MINLKFKHILIPILLGINLLVFGQQDTSLTQQVEVVKAYKPNISDAFKINDLPKINETDHQKPNFSYNIFSQPIYNTFSVNNLKAATFAQKPAEEAGFGFVKAGFGNYSKPYAEVFFNNKDSRNFIFGLHGKHVSSHGNIKLSGGNKVKAPFSENEAELYFKRLYSRAVLSVNLGIDHDGFKYYGYPQDSIPAVLSNENQEYNYQGKNQTFTKGGLNINLANKTTGSSDLAFDFNFTYHYFGTKTEQREHFAEFMADIQKPIEKGTGILTTGATLINTSEIFNRTLLETGKNQQIWLTAQPAYYLGNETANVKVGFKTWFVMDNDVDAVAKVAPDIRFNFVPVKEIINLYAGIDGNYIKNHYSKIAYENPFVDPTHDVKNSMEKFRFYGGFDGKFATKTNFKISADYSIFKNQALYYLYEHILPLAGQIPNPSVVDNTFRVFYDHMDRLKFNVEIFHASTSSLDLLFSGNYYSYKMENEEKAWNLPDWDANLSLSYSVTEQLKVSTDLYLIGKRTALILENTKLETESKYLFNPATAENVIRKSFILDTAFDLNFNANYQLSQQFSVFAQLNNIGFQKYQRWFGYPVQSFNFLGGVSYAF